MDKRIYFESYVAATSYGDAIEFGFEADHIRIIHDGTGTVTMSFDKTNDHGVIKSTDVPPFSDFPNFRESKIWIKSTQATDPVRVWAWRSGR